jgi:hypothetical protein
MAYLSSVAPTAIVDGNMIYSYQPAGGGSGIYQKSLTTADELVSRNRALVFSLVL